jgi:hypothetical protein
MDSRSNRQAIKIKTHKAQNVDIDLKFIPDLIILFENHNDRQSVRQILGDINLYDNASKYFHSLVEKNKKSCFLMIQKGSLNYKIVDSILDEEIRDTSL